MLQGLATKMALTSSFKHVTTEKKAPENLLGECENGFNRV